MNLFKRLPGSQRVGLKLYANVSVFGGLELNATIKHARFADVKQRAKPKGRNHIELRDRGCSSFEHIRVAFRSFIERLYWSRLFETPIQMVN